jgi:hypothetical protein
MSNFPSTTTPVPASAEALRQARDNAQTYIELDREEGRTPSDYVIVLNARGTSYFAMRADGNVSGEVEAGARVVETVEVFKPAQEGPRTITPEQMAAAAPFIGEGITGMAIRQESGLLELTQTRANGETNVRVWIHRDGTVVGTPAQDDRS